MRPVIRRAKYRIAFGEAILSKIKRRKTLCYQTESVGYMTLAFVCGPFHSKYYGTCAITFNPDDAPRRLSDNLASRGWYGKLRKGPDESDRTLLDRRRSDMTMDA